VLVSNNLK
jgi:hypothetical protein